ncbi:TPA: transposase [Candidatus Poribacteria bacterium]|nr:transposase [Candidatus Poribacteria bacterium]HIB90478.1 transposase [Candidatus Poribacteria bacterium]HIC03237.1 transposase [Candidatus Poribacteria bacterium]HIC18048.1 transposase [Candidatus Poribacteria bacterium]HIM09257.1 transposase [Candidatus Poribacteria bacterium]
MLVLQINNGIDYSLNPAESDPRGVYLRQWDQRLILNSILCLVTIGCQWRMLPRTFHLGKLFIAITANGVEKKSGFCFTCFTSTNASPSW